MSSLFSPRRRGAGVPAGRSATDRLAESVASGRVIASQTDAARTAEVDCFQRFHCQLLAPDPMPSTVENGEDNDRILGHHKTVIRLAADPSTKEGAGMAERPSDLGATWWGKNLDEVDSEVARLASICGVRILDPGVIERVLHGDATVCGNSNTLAFDKLRNVMMMHYKIRERAVGAIGEAETEVLIKAIVERLQKRLAGNLGGPPAA